jgi:hypothetical protein
MQEIQRHNLVVIPTRYDFIVMSIDNADEIEVDDVMTLVPSAKGGGGYRVVRHKKLNIAIKQWIRLYGE